jgi:homoserine O-succinyltransferase
MIRPIHIGLVNNMPDSALLATERQFRALLAEAADGLPVRLSLFGIAEVPRSEHAKSRMSKSYSSIDVLWDSCLDGIIVTGAEPRLPSLTEEPYWNTLAQVIDWAQENTYSGIYSCLAAHAAVLRMDGIRRRTLNDKLCGVYECATISDHRLTEGIPARSWMPHSRWNDIPENALSSSGYRIVTRSKEAGVDTFVKQGKSLSVFFQGHPEYEAGSLSLEYRRDERRFLNGESTIRPLPPHGLRNSWHFSAVQMYRNWLRYLSEQIQGRVEYSTEARAQWTASR